MSPEQDGKLFTPDTMYGYDDHVNRYYQLWQQLSTLPCAKKWPAHDEYQSTFLPPSLSTDERWTALQEIYTMPEQFYTTFHWLPVITPELYIHFESTIGPSRIALWSFCSGSSLLLATMAQMPFQQAVLFPVDLRYGWDLRNDYHQQLLRRANEKYQPFLTTTEPRNQHWCKHNRD